MFLLQNSERDTNPIGACRAICYALVDAGGLEGAKTYLDKGLKITEKLHDRLEIYQTLNASIVVNCISGDWSSANKLFGSSLKLVDESVQLRYISLIKYELGNFEAANEFVERIIEFSRRENQLNKIGVVIPRMALVSGRIDQLDIAESIAHDNDDDFALSLIAVLKKDVAIAKCLYRELVSQQRVQYLSTNSSWLIGLLLTYQRFLGLLAQTAGKLDGAMKHFYEAHSFCKKAGYLPELGWTCCDWSDALIQRGTAVDRSKAKDLLEEGLAIAEKLGMKPLKERITEHLEKLEKQEKPVYPDGLIKREMEVLKLLATGKANKEIAAELFISDRTVVNHVSRIFEKTGMTNRTEAASYAYRMGILTA